MLLNKKGGVFHKRAGYTYVVSMLVLNVTAFMIYRLFGKFGPFHVLAIISMAGIVGGMIPVIFRRHIGGWIYYHYYFINWSVVGLYAAFWAETLTRTLPMGRFWPIVMGATAVTASIGSYLIRKNAARFLPAKQEKSPQLMGA